MSESDAEAWVKDLSLPAPDPVDLALYAARAAGAKDGDLSHAGRECALRLARIALALDEILRGERLARHQAVASLKDIAHTMTVALERLQQQEELVAAAVAWYQAGKVGSGRDFLAAATRLRAAAHKQHDLQEKQS